MALDEVHVGLVLLPLLVSDHLTMPMLTDNPCQCQPITATTGGENHFTTVKHKWQQKDTPRLSAAAMEHIFNHETTNAITNRADVA